MKQRQSNLELLRIVSIAMIVMFHGNIFLGIPEELSVNQAFSQAIWMLGRLGDNLFMLISGFFMVVGHFRWNKLILLILEVQFYYWLASLVGWITGIWSIPTGTDLFLAFFPVITIRWWFITAYLLVYLISPYLNLMTEAMNSKRYKIFLLTILTPTCFIPTFFGIFSQNTEDVLYFNGFIWLATMYLVGGYLRRIASHLKAVALPLTVASASVMAAFITTINCFGDCIGSFIEISPLYLQYLNNIPVVGLSIGVFGLFLKSNVPQSRIINKIASTCLGIYLLSDSPQLRDWIWTTVFRLPENRESTYAIVFLVGATAIVMLVGIGIDLIRQQCEKPIGRLLGKVWKKSGREPDSAG